MNYLRYIEPQSHGTPDFPVGCYYVDENHPSYEMPFHWHREMEICYIVSGAFTFYLNGQEVVANSGDTVFIDQGVLHGGNPQNCVYICTVFDPRILLHTDTCRNYMRYLTSSDIHIHCHFPATNRGVAKITKVLCTFSDHSHPGRELSILGALFQWFGHIYETGQYAKTAGTTKPDSEKSRALRPVLEYIEQNYMTNITLDTLARQAGMSSRYFCRFFHAMIHRTPIEYLTYYRIEHACYLLATTKLPITEVSGRCGFNDSSYFVRIFKKQKNITPKQYQLQYR